MRPLRAAVLLSTIACAWLPNAVNAQRDARAANPPTPAPVQRALMPGGMVADSAFANGCWIRFFDGIDYRGDQLLIVGPMRPRRANVASARRWVLDEPALLNDWMTIGATLGLTGSRPGRGSQ